MIMLLVSELQVYVFPVKIIIHTTSFKEVHQLISPILVMPTIRNENTKVRFGARSPTTAIGEAYEAQVLT
jgi:hypothetical protein